MSWSRKTVAALAATLGCVALLPPVSAATTLKDGFGSRETVKGVPFVVPGSNVGAEREAEEPILKPLAPAGHSVWLQWETMEQGYYTLSTCGSSIPTVLGVYSGTTLGSLNEVGSAANFGGGECSGIRNGVTFLELVTGKNQIVVDGDSFFVPPALPPVTEGSISLQIEATPPPANDDFANAAPLTGRVFEEPGSRFYFADVFGYDWAATKEKDEPKHAGDSGGASVWYSWTAPESGMARVNLCCGSAPNLIGVYTGNSLDTLVPVASGKGAPVESPVTAGTTYRIAVDGEFFLFLGTPLAGSFNLRVAMNLAAGPVQSGDSGGGSTASPPPSLARDVKAPKTTIFKTSVRSKARAASLFFRSDDSSSSFRCKLDKRKTTACTSPTAYTGLAPGSHIFKVAAVDAAGNVDPTPATARLLVTPPPKHRRG